VSYKKTDSNGYYKFEVPISYGSNYLAFRSYDNFGEEKSFERLIQIPSSFLPAGEFEYTLTAGRLKYLDWKKTSELLFNYGINSHITLGSGLQYIDDSRVSRFTPFLHSSARVGDNLIVSGEYIYKNRSRGKLNLLLPSQIGTEISYTRYAVNRFFNTGKYSEEKNFLLQLPFRKEQISFGFRFNLREVSYLNDYRFLNGFGSAYIYLYGIYSSLNTSASWSRIEGRYKSQIFMSSILTSFNLFKNILFQSQMDIDHYRREVNFVRANFYRNIFNGLWLDFSIYRNFISKVTGFSLNLRWDLPFSQINSRMESSQNHYTFYQNARGTIGYDANKDQLLTDNRNWVRRGAVTVRPFLDENNNGILDVNETELSLKMRADISSGKSLHQPDNNNLWIVDLEPYDTCFIQIDQTSFDNPLLKLRYNKYSFIVDPNRFKDIAIPIYTTGEVSGKVLKESVKGLKALSGVKINFQRVDGSYRTDAKSISSGEYFCESFLPGVYKVFIDSALLRKLSLLSVPDTLYFEVKSRQEGDIIDGLNFVLRERKIAKLDTTSVILDSVKISETIIKSVILFDTLKTAKLELKLKVSKRINFKYLNTMLDSAIMKFLDTLAIYLKNKANIFVEIEGHTDNWGTAKQNQRISQMRADRVREYLLFKGVDAKILKSIALGNRHPIASNTNAGSRAKNRRVEIIIESGR
jgi:outer membrane protein OmpA-like peptidoglycan-associated protein